MGFYRLISDKTQEEIDELLSEMSPSEFEYINMIYKSFEHIEWADSFGFCGMYAILDDELKSKVQKIYDSNDIHYKFEDLISEVLWGEFIETNYMGYVGDNISDVISYLIEEYYNENITVDIILDKINERGIHTLSSSDLKVLDGFT